MKNFLNLINPKCPVHAIMVVTSRRREPPILKLVLRRTSWWILLKIDTDMQQLNLYQNQPSISTHRTLRALSTASLTTLHANTEPRTFKFKSELIGHLLLDLHETRWTCSAHRGWSASTVVFDWTNPKRAVVTAKVRQCSPTFCKSWEPIPVFSAITSKRLGSHFYKCWSCGHLYKGWHWSHLNKCWQCSHLYKEWRQSLLYKCWLCSHLYKCWSRSHLYK